MQGIIFENFEFPFQFICNIIHYDIESKYEHLTNICSISFWFHSIGFSFLFFYFQFFFIFRLINFYDFFVPFFAHIYTKDNSFSFFEKYFLFEIIMTYVRQHMLTWVIFDVILLFCQGLYILCLLRIFA